MHLKEAATNTAIPVKHISDMLDDLRLLSGFNDVYNGRRKIWPKAVMEYLMIRKAEKIYRKFAGNDIKRVTHEYEKHALRFAVLHKYQVVQSNPMFTPAKCH